MRDKHQHCPCTGVWLCPTCHAWAHAHPEQARDTGFILSKFIDSPGEHPFRTPVGWKLPDCTGGWSEP